MRFITSSHIEATDSIHFTDRTDLAATIFHTGESWQGEVMVAGTVANRADFLRRLATAATQAADELDMGRPSVRVLLDGNEVTP